MGGKMPEPRGAGNGELPIRADRDGESEILKLL